MVTHAINQFAKLFQGYYSVTGETIIEKKLCDLRVSVVSSYTCVNGENCCSEEPSKFNPVPQSVKKQHVLSHFAIVKLRNNLYTFCHLVELKHNPKWVLIKHFNSTN